MEDASRVNNFIADLSKLNEFVRPGGEGHPNFGPMVDEFLKMYKAELKQFEKDKGFKFKRDAIVRQAQVQYFRSQKAKAELEKRRIDPSTLNFED